MSLRFATALFVSAMLLFTCQPLVARMIVPLLGGSPSVWIVCSLCFQALLLAGYGYAHFLGTRLSVKTQVAVQLALVATVFAVLPVAVDEAVAARLTASHPTVGLLLLLLRTIGLPFFVLSTTSPLLQRWFAELGEKDPYHLYAASNAGSMLALLGYPFVVEPLLAVKAQSRALHVGYAGYALLLVVCAITTVRYRSPARVDATPAPPQVRASDSERPILAGIAAPPVGARWPQRFVWVALAFAPSSLLLAATEYVTTDIASVPLLWVVPLAIYLASFIVAFGKKQPIGPALWSRALALGATLVAALVVADVQRPSWLVAAAHVGLLFLGSVVCHRALAMLRPPVERLTEFYLLLSVGGVLGGMFNGLLAPVLFDDLVEYPLAIGLVCLGRVVLDAERDAKTSNVRRDALLGGAAALFALLAVRIGLKMYASPAVLRGALLVALAIAFAWSKPRPVRFAVALVGIVLAGMRNQPGGEEIFADRGFFGVLAVKNDTSRGVRTLVYGRTVHGIQSLDPAKAAVPLAYYHPAGPAGDVLGPLPDEAAREGLAGGRSVGVIGLGVGSLAAYARSGDRWTFFELNPTVVTIAEKNFTFVPDARKRATVDVEIGDARLRLRAGPPNRFDTLVLDAFSSDAIPMHLVTREALAVYRRSLRPDGVLLAHVSNQHLNLRPVLAALAHDAGMFAMARVDNVSPAESEAGRANSIWVVLTESAAELARIGAKSPGAWVALMPAPGQPVWSDDFANVLGALR